MQWRKGMARSPGPFGACCPCHGGRINTGVMAPSADDSSYPPRFGLLRRLTLLALVLAVVGLPLNNLLGYGLLLAATVIVFAGQVTARNRPWLLSILFAFIAVMGQAVLSPPAIEEGHNLFLPDGKNDALVSGLPPDVYRLMAAEFDKTYPPDKRCDPNTNGCWRGLGFPDRVYGFSGDGILRGAEMSRKVDHIDFADPVWLRLGFSNDLRYNWSGKNHDLVRVKRDGRFWMGLHRWQFGMPFFVTYRFPAAYAGSDLCWKGDLIWEDRTEQFALLSNPLWACRAIEPGDIGRRIYGIAVKPGQLAMSFDPPVSIHLRQALATGLCVFSIVTIVGLLVRWRRRDIVLPFTLIALSLAAIAIDDASFIGGLRPLDGGDDGLFYQGMGRQIAQHILAGNFHAALEGGERVFFYGGPGLRYFRALEMFIFGDTNLGYLSLVLLLPFVVFALNRRFLPTRWALALVMLFVAIPVGALFGTSFFHYAKWAARGFADPAACIFAFSAVVLLIGRKAGGPGRGFGIACAAGFLFFLGIFMRPNIAPFVAVMLGGAGLAALYQREWLRLSGLCIGFLPVISMALHNWYFGGVFVLFSANATHSSVFKFSGADYLSALADVLRLNLASEHVSQIAQHLVRWLSGPSELPAMVPFHVLAFVVLVRVLTRAGFDRWLRLIAAAALAQHVVGLFYTPAPRYHFLASFFTGLICVVWFKVEGIDLLRRLLPLWWERIWNNPFNRSIERGLRQFEIISGLLNFPGRRRVSS